MNNQGDGARPLEPLDEAAERAARVATMLGRWAQQGPATDPEWDIGDVAPLSLRSAADSGTPSGQ